MAHAVFIHGLNTYGDDDIHIGPLKLGPMHAHLAEGLAKYGVKFHALTGLGMGTPEEQADRAAGKLGDIDSFYLLGQSTGGLVARVMAARPELKKRVKGIITWGTPHQGTAAARFGLEFGKNHPGVQKLFATFGYDTQKKAQIFSSFTPEALDEFNRKYPAIVPEYSLLCEVEARYLSWPLKVFYRKLHPNGEPSDGFIWSESQKRGNVLGPYHLDHFGELGSFPFVSVKDRIYGAREFERLMGAIADIVSK